MKNNLKQFYKSIWPVSTGHELIRVGGINDGSYLLPDLLTGIELCLSPGTCGVIDFEIHLAQSYGIPSLLCDPSDDLFSLNLPEYLKFDKMFLSDSDSADSFQLSTWLSKYGYQDSSPLLLSMDIEGGEIPVLNSLSLSELSKFRMATIEFHYFHLFHSNTPEANQYFNQVNAIISKLKSLFDIVHIKPNNNCPFSIQVDDTPLTLYTCLEITFLNKLMRKHKPYSLPVNQLPHLLDYPNVLDKPEANYSAYSLFL